MVFEEREMPMDLNLIIFIFFFILVAMHFLTQFIGIETLPLLVIDANTLLPPVVVGTLLPLVVFDISLIIHET